MTTVSNAAVLVRWVRCPQHAPFIASTLAYAAYVENWNSKLNEMRPMPQWRRGRCLPRDFVAALRISANNCAQMLRELGVENDKEDR